MPGPLTEEERARLLDRLELLERSRDDLIELTIADLARGYGDDLNSLIQDVHTAVARLESEGQLAGSAGQVGGIRLDILRSAMLVEPLWERWRARLDELDGRLAQLMQAGGGRSQLSGATREMIAELRGLWPDAASPQGSGLAGRFFGLSNQQRQELANIVTRSVLGRGTRSRLVTELAQVTGREKKQAEALFDDSTIQYSRAVQDREARERGHEYFEYMGPLDKVTRPFCRRYVGRILSREEIDQLDNGQTGVGTVMIAGGGFRCRHHWRPVREEWFDEAEWAQKRGQTAPSTAPAQTTGAPVVRIQSSVQASRRSAPIDVANLEGRKLTRHEVDRLLQSDQFEDRRAAIVNAWVHGTSKHVPVHVRAAILAELGPDLGLKGVIWNRGGVDIDKALVGRLRADVRRIYEDTQRALRAAPVERIRVERGEKTSVTSPAVCSSWTTDPDVAERFRGSPERHPHGRIRREDVPAERVFMWHDGPGWHNGIFGAQSDWLVLE